MPDWPSKLNGRIKTQGSLYGGSWQMSVPELKITGNVKQNKVDVAGSLQGNSYLQWKIPGLHLALGPNSARSEERRVGKECRSRWSPYH